MRKVRILTHRFKLLYKHNWRQLLNMRYSRIFLLYHWLLLALLTPLPIVNQVNNKMLRRLLNSKITKEKLLIPLLEVFHTNRIIVNCSIGWVRWLLILLARLVFITTIYIYIKPPIYNCRHSITRSLLNSKYIRQISKLSLYSCPFAYKPNNYLLT